MDPTIRIKPKRTWPSATLITCIVVLPWALAIVLHTFPPARRPAAPDIVAPGAVIEPGETIGIHIDLSTGETEVIRGDGTVQRMPALMPFGRVVPDVGRLKLPRGERTMIGVWENGELKRMWSDEPDAEQYIEWLDEADETEAF